MSSASMDVLHTLNQRFCHLYPGEVAHELTDMAPRDALEALAPQSPLDQARVWERLPLDIADAMLQEADHALLALLIPTLDPVFAAALLRRAGELQRERVMGAVPPAVWRDLQRLMSYPPDTAGSLMDPQLVTLEFETTVTDALQRLRRDQPRFSRFLYIVDDDRHLLGAVSIEALALAEAGTRVGKIARPVPMVVSVMSHRDELIDRVSRERIADVPVTDQDGRLLGVIHYEQLMGAVHEETSLDIQTMFGASRDEGALSPIGFAVRKRLPWLQINLLTAFLAAAVVGLFEHTIAQFTALAVLLPVVAGQSGNSGAQALAVTMRGLAVREIGERHMFKVIGKELSTGLVNGLAIALTTALGVWLWSGSAGLALVIAVAMVISMGAAGLAGAGIPILLTAAGQDPAQSSSIILTTVTDVVGFLSFLGIATLLANLL